MSNSLPPDRLKSITNELARERNRAAAERTLMAWIRTCLALIGFGIGIDRIVNAIYFSAGAVNRPTGLSQTLGLAFIALGTFSMVAASFEHYQELQRIDRGDYTYRARISLGLIVALSLILIGFIAFITILAKALLAQG
jgi:putative membrane protein